MTPSRLIQKHTDQRAENARTIVSGFLRTALELLLDKHTRQANTSRSIVDSRAEFSSPSLHQEETRIKRAAINLTLLTETLSDFHVWPCRRRRRMG